MKSPAQIEHAIEVTKKAAAEIKTRIQNLQTFVDAGNFMQDNDFFIAQVLEKFDLKARLQALEKQIDAYNYVLERDRD